MTEISLLLVDKTLCRRVDKAVETGKWRNLKETQSNSVEVEEIVASTPPFDGLVVKADKAMVLHSIPEYLYPKSRHKSQRCWSGTVKSLFIISHSHLFLMRLLTLFLFLFLLPERVSGCQSNVTEIHEDLKLSANVNCSWSRLRKVHGRLELSASNHNTLISLPQLEEIVGSAPPLLTIRATSAELTVHLPRLAVLQVVGNSSSQPLIKIEGPVVVGARLLLNLKRLSGGKMEIEGVSLARWLSTNKLPGFSPEPMIFFLCAVSLLILVYVLLRGFHRWQVMKLDEDVKKDLAQMKDYLLERRKAKFDRFKGDENIRRILGIGDKTTSTVDQETMEQWLAREHNKEEEKRRRQKKFSSYMGNKAETREKTARQQPEDVVRKRRQKADGLSKAYKRAEETSGERPSKKK